MRSLASFPAKMTTNETGSKRVPRNEAGGKSLPLSEKKESPVQVGEVMELTRKVFEAVSFYIPFLVQMTSFRAKVHSHKQMLVPGVL